MLSRVQTTAGQGGIIEWYAASITTTLPTSIEAGEVLTVSAAYQYQMITPFVGAIANGQVLTLTANSAATIIRVPNCTDAAAGCQ